MEILSTIENRKISDFSNKEFWNLSIERYRISKKVRKLLPRNKDKSFDYNSLAEKIGFDRHYIYQVAAMNLYPCEEFITKLENLND